MSLMEYAIEGMLGGHLAGMEVVFRARPGLAADLGAGSDPEAACRAMAAVPERPAPAGLAYFHSVWTPAPSRSREDWIRELAHRAGCNSGERQPQLAVLAALEGAGFRETARHQREALLREREAHRSYSEGVLVWGNGGPGGFAMTPEGQTWWVPGLDARLGDAPAIGYRGHSFLLSGGWCVPLDAVRATAERLSAGLRRVPQAQRAAHLAPLVAELTAHFGAPRAPICFDD